MDLQTWCSAEVGRAARLAKAVGIPASFVSQIAAGGRSVPPKHCIAIEQATGRVVRRWDLRPDDWWLIWPELTKAKGAPSVPHAATEA